MRKYILALMVLSGVAAAQRLRVPLLHRDPVDTQRTALHDKLTRLSETRQSLGMPEAQPASAPELDALTASAQHIAGGPAKSASVRKQEGSPKQKQLGSGSQWPPPDQTWSAADRQPSLGEVARKERARKRQTTASSKQ